MVRRGKGRGVDGEIWGVCACGVQIILTRGLLPIVPPIHEEPMVDGFLLSSKGLLAMGALAFIDGIARGCQQLG